MSENHTLIAFLGTLIAIVVLVMLGAWLSVNQRPTEALGIGGAVTGLIGVIGTFKPRTVSTDVPQDVNIVNPTEEPVPVKENKK